MTKLKTLASLIAVAVLAAACNTTPNHATGAVKLHENTTGGYLAPKDSPHYTAVKGTLYAWDGERWFVLRAPEIDSGEMRGARLLKPERWTVAGGSRITTYYRSGSTFRDQDLRPVFIQQ